MCKRGRDLRRSLRVTEPPGQGCDRSVVGVFLKSRITSVFCRGEGSIGGKICNRVILQLVIENLRFHRFSISRLPDCSITNLPGGYRNPSPRLGVTDFRKTSLAQLPSSPTI